MADVSKEEIRKEIAAILKTADLSTTSSKKVRQTLESKLKCDLSARRKEIDDLVMDYVNKDKRKKKRDESEDDDDDQDDDVEEEEEDDDDESEEESKPAKRGSSGKKPAAKKKKGNSDDSEEESDDDDYGGGKKKGAAAKSKKAAPKKKKGSDSDSDDDWKTKKAPPKKAAGASGAKRGGSGYTRAYTLSPELAALMGQESMARHEVVKRVWQIIKERDLYDPKNKQFAICDDDLFKVIGVKRFRTFGMMKFLKTHFID